MRMIHKYFSASIITLCSLLFTDCANAQSVSPFSQYGQIQNVQNYASNPFWNPSGPYNQRIPTPVYVDGPEMNAGDCLRTVSALVANTCATMNNCAGMRLSDIRPTLMLQLSQLPGHTYATSCAGYIDTEFEKYVKKYGHAGVAAGTTSFPTPTTSQTAFPTPTTSVRNPYSPQTPEWEREYNERAAELAELQAQTAKYGEELSQTDFPATFADLDFDERMDVLATGYEPYQGKSAYHPIQIQSYEDYLEDMKKYAKKTEEKEDESKKDGGDNTTCKITYKCGNGSGTAPNGTTVQKDANYTLAQNTCTTPDGKTFAGWNDGTTTRDAGTQMTCHSKNITYTAKYSDGTKNNYMEANTPPTARPAI